MKNPEHYDVDTILIQSGSTNSIISTHTIFLSMIFERLANGIVKHSKLIIVLWIVALVIAVPFISKAMDKLDYNTDDMANPDSESSIGSSVLAEYFSGGEGESGYIDLLVITFSDSEGEDAADNLEIFLMADNFFESFDNGAIELMVPYESFVNSDGSGMKLLAILFSDEAVSDGRYTSDTAALREWIEVYVSQEESENNAELTTYLTGSPAITYDTMTNATEDVEHIDMVSIPLIIIIVGLFFRSIFSSTMPPITIGIAIAIAFLSLFFIGSVMDIFFITEMFIIVSMLGAGCDYCIFIISRYREERRKGSDHNAAIKDAIMWAGESITTSGIAVMIGFGAMAICSFSMISGMGIMLAIGIFIALMAALTLITSILNLLGERMFWPSKIESFQEGSKSMNGWYGKCARLGNRYFRSSVRFSLKHAKAIIVASLLFTAPMVYIVSTSETSYDMIGTMLTGESKDGLATIEDYTDGGLIMPDYEVMELTESIATISNITVDDTEYTVLTWNDNNISKYLESLNSLSTTMLNGDNNIGEAYSIQMWSVIAETAIAHVGEKNPTESDSDYLLKLFNNDVENKEGILYGDYVPSNLMVYMWAIYYATEGYIALIDDLSYDNEVYAGIVDYMMNYETGIVGGTSDIDDGDINITYVKMTIITREQSMSDRSMKTLNNVESYMDTFMSENSDLFANSWLTGTSAIMYEISSEVNQEFIKVIALAIVLILLLLLVVMSSWITPFRSVLTILMSIVWTIAITHLIFTDMLGYGVIWLIPIILIVVCLGLGMDYDILLTTRIKENHVHKGMSNDDAIHEGVITSGSVITICGLIMGGAFATLMMSNMVMLQEFGFALAFAIIVDALIVRTYIVPAMMHLMGEWNWKGPKFLKKKDQEMSEKMD